MTTIMATTDRARRILSSFGDLALSFEDASRRLILVGRSKPGAHAVAAPCHCVRSAVHASLVIPSVARDLGGRVARCVWHPPTRVPRSPAGGRARRHSD